MNHRVMLFAVVRIALLAPCLILGGCEHPTSTATIPTKPVVASDPHWVEDIATDDSKEVWWDYASTPESPICGAAGTRTGRAPFTGETLLYSWGVRDHTKPVSHGSEFLTMDAAKHAVEKWCAEKQEER